MSLTIGEVAQALGVSKGTVSRAITGKGRIAPATKTRIVEYMAAHDFSPNAAAQNLSTRKTMTIAFTVPTDHGLVHLSFFLQGLIGAIEQAMAHSYDILTVSNTADAVKRVVSQRKVDAVIVSRDPGASPMLDYLTNVALPFVLIGPTARPGVLRVDHDHRAACREFTAAVLRQWQGRPGLLVGPSSDLVSQARFDGFTQGIGSTPSACGATDEVTVVSGLAQAGEVPVALDPTHVGGASRVAPVVWGAVDEESVVRGFTRLRDAGADIVFCGDDRICGYLESAILGGRLPESARRVRIASFHGSPSLEALNPRVPVLRFDSGAIGSAACTLLLDRITGKDVADITLGYEIVLGERDGRVASDSESASTRAGSNLRIDTPQATESSPLTASPAKPLPSVSGSTSDPSALDPTAEPVPMTGSDVPPPHE